MCRKWRENHSARLDLRGSGRKTNTLGAVDLIDGHDDFMRVDGADGPVDRREDLLRHSDRMEEKNAALAGLLIRAPPRVDVADRLDRPSEDRQPESGFGDKGVAANGLEGGARGVALQLIVAGYHPDFAGPLQADLCTA